MAKKISSVKSTSGAGFPYEDKVAAYYLIHMLAGRPPLEPGHGIAVSLRWQVRGSGWFFDDLLLTLTKDGQERYFAVSVKSNKQVKRSGFPSDFVNLAWEQWLGETSNPFRRSRDRIGLVTGRLAVSVKTALDTMVSQAREGDPASVARRLSTARQSSKVVRDLFASLQCPTDLQGPEGTDSLAAASLLKHILVLHLDFESVPSNDEKTAIGICQDMLESGDPYEASRLWRYLTGLATEKRRAGGTIDLLELIQMHSPSFNLREYPYYQADWEQINRRSQEAMDEIKDCVGRGEAAIPRQKLLDSLKQAAERTKVIALVGESGTGKSSLAKRFTEYPGNFDTVVWMNGAILDRDSLASVESDLGLQHSLSDVMRAAAAPKPVLVLDGIERFSKRALGNASKLLAHLGLAEEGCRWRVMLTCQGEGWTRAAYELLPSGIPKELFGKQEVESPSLEEVDRLIFRFPELRNLGLKGEFKELIRNLKILDWIVSYSGGDPLADLPRVTCLTELVDWVWDRWAGETEDVYCRAHVLKRLGEIEGCSLSIGVPISDFTVQELRLLKGLMDSQLIRVKDARVYFRHDLAGDWARLRTLIEKGHDLPEMFIEHARLPRWHRAIRLYAQRVLEQNGLQEWRNLLSSFVGDSDDEGLVRNLFLESAICGTGSEDTLNQLWGDVSADNGHLLTRLLRQFLHIGTVGHPVAKQTSHDQREVRELEALIRKPYGPYWQRMIEFLHGHKDGIPPASRYAASRICGLWLENTPVRDESGRPFRLRRQAAETALVIARQVQKGRYTHTHLEDRQAEVAYKAALYGAPELPDEVSQLALELCERKASTDDLQAMDGDRGGTRDPEDEGGGGVEDSDELIARPQSWPAREPLREPWPDGPSRRVDEAFRTACLGSQALLGLIQIKPKVAYEVVLALCIEAPGYSCDLLDMRFGTERVSDLSPPMFFRGPFLRFLRISPETGLDLIIRLVNFATERWAACQAAVQKQCSPEEGRPLITARLDLDGESVELQGDFNVYGWHRSGLMSENTVVCALMALEKWLYEELEAGHEIDRWLKLILNRSRSAALVGVLAALGKKEPSLLAGPLRPILGICEIYKWDGLSVLHPTLWEAWEWQELGKPLHDLALSWYQLPHRRARLKDLVDCLMLTDTELVKFLVGANERWSQAGLLHIDTKQFEHGTADLNLIAFAMKCRERLESREPPLQQEELDGFCAQLFRFDDIAAATPDLTRKEDAICGGIAVLLTMHRDWLEAHHEREKWCIDKLVSIASSSPPRGQYEFPETVSHHDWECFLGECSVVLLSENRQEETFRRLVAGSVVGYLYLTTKLTMEAANRMRDRLGDDFVRMQNLAVEWAAVRCVDVHAQGLRLDLGEWPEESRAALVEQFVSGETESTVSSWEPVRTWGRQQLDQIQGEAKSAIWSSGLDHEVLKSDFDWLPSLDQARENERDSWIAIHRELLSVTLTEVANRGIDRRMKRVEGHPSKYDMWVFDRIAQLIPCLEPEESEPFWRAILDLPPEADRWIERFLVRWVPCGVRASRSPEMFVDHWRPMIEYAFNSPTWNRANASASQPGHVWNALMGLGHNYDVIGGEEFAKPLASLLPFFWQWAESWLWNAWNLATFASFLCQPGAGNLICSGVQWVRDALAEYDEDKWRHCDRLEYSIASLLWECWEKHRPELRSDDGFRGAFLCLLALLTNRQSPSALRLNGEVGSSLSR